MKTLGFAPACERTDGRRIRRAVFEERSLLPVSAACLVANGVRETLSALFADAVALKLYEPVIPSRSAWNAILRDAAIYCVRGSNVEAAVVVRARDASMLAAAAFGERGERPAPLSAIERTVIDRTVRAVAAQFAPICGPGNIDVDVEHGDLDGFATFFELQIERPVQARIGVALRHDPLPEARPGVTLEELLDLTLELCAAVDLGRLSAAQAGSLEPGAVLPLPPGPLRGTLRIAGRTLASGECGVCGPHYAFSIDRACGGGETPAL
ncbi:MAG TPA: hypothetical protein VMA98_12320 [Candidatus Acidoferrales bacterium]|nr:hypothetical protein [Candidatus Acidoferrales bacterium]